VLVSDPFFFLAAVLPAPSCSFCPELLVLDLPPIWLCWSS
jgi:hypothetical protein